MTKRKLDAALEEARANGYAIIYQHDLDMLMDMNQEKTNLIEQILEDNRNLLERVHEYRNAALHDAGVHDGGVAT